MSFWWDFAKRHIWAIPCGEQSLPWPRTDKTHVNYDALKQGNQVVVSLGFQPNQDWSPVNEWTQQGPMLAPLIFQTVCVCLKKTMNCTRKLVIKLSIFSGGITNVLCMALKRTEMIHHWSVTLNMKITILFCWVTILIIRTYVCIFSA